MTDKISFLFLEKKSFSIDSDADADTDDDVDDDSYSKSGLTFSSSCIDLLNLTDNISLI